MIESKDLARVLLVCFPSLISALLSWLHSPVNSFHVMEKMTAGSYWLTGACNLRPQGHRVFSVRIHVNFWEKTLFNCVWIPRWPLNLSPGGGHIDGQLGLCAHSVSTGQGSLSNSLKETIWNRGGAVCSSIYLFSHLLIQKCLLSTHSEPKALF